MVDRPGRRRGVRLPRQRCHPADPAQRARA
jgi:hypothetical protein